MDSNTNWIYKCVEANVDNEEYTWICETYTGPTGPTDPTSPTIKAFIHEGLKYTFLFEEGMTWRQFIDNTDYSYGIFLINDDGHVAGESEDPLILANDASETKYGPDEVIVPGIYTEA